MSHDPLKEYLNILWLRPENALWSAYQEHALRTAPHKLISPAVDIGGGSGLPCFTMMGGKISPEYDFFSNVGGLESFFKGKDIYDSFSHEGNKSLVLQKPNFVFDVSFDHKENLLKQAEFLGIYKKTITADGNKKWPIEDASMQSAFSNILYWLQDHHHSFKELRRILKVGGKAFLFLQTKNFTKFCKSYHPQDYPIYEKTLRILNRSRVESHLWQTDLEEIRQMAKAHGFKVLHHRYCYSQFFLNMWDIGLRPLSPVLIDMANSFDAKQRKKYKEWWVNILYEILRPIYDEETKKPLKEGGYMLVVLEKR
ncbi:MAG: hypothetical protein Q8R36_05780 [bacterium]|nr:hypothetical protein [bacterium]